MNTLVNILLVAFIILGTYIGTRKGLIKSAVGFVGLVAIVIISYTLKGVLAEFLIDFLPLMNYGGALEGLTAINILFYNIVSFIFVFIILYCILNIVISLTGFIDTLLKFTVIWIIPSKIGGAIIGFLETWIFLYLLVFVFSQFGATNAIIQESKVADVILNNTPVIGTYLGSASIAAEEIYKEIDDALNDENVDREELNLRILQIQISRGLISSDKANELMDTGKLTVGNAIISTPKRG